MNRINTLTVMSFVIGLTVLAFGVDLGRAEQSLISTNSTSGQGKSWTLKDAENEAAALRKKQGMMRQTTNIDRLAAAKRNAERKAAKNKGKGNGGGK